MKTLQTRLPMVLMGLLAVAVLFALALSSSAAAQDSPPPLNVEPVDGGIRLTWSAIEGAAYYKLFYRRANIDNPWHAIMIQDRAYTISGLINGVDYQFSVIPMNRKELPINPKQNRREAIVAPNGPIFPPPTLTAMPGEAPGSVNLSWTAASGASSYVYQYKARTQLWNPYPSEINLNDVYLKTKVEGGTTTATVTNLDPGTQYTFRLHVKTKTARSDWVETEVWPKMSQPMIHSVTGTNRSVTLAWNAIPGATGYAYQYRAGQAGNWSGEMNAAGGSVDVDSLNNGTEYAFRVRATGPGSSSWSDLVYATPTASPNDYPSTPGQANVDPGTTAALFTWQSGGNGVNGTCPDTSYHVTITDSDAQAVVIESPPITAKENQSHYRWYVEGLTPGKTYAADISAYGEQCSTNSQTTAHLSFDMTGEDNPGEFAGLEVNDEEIKRPFPIRALNVQRTKGFRALVTWTKPKANKDQRCPLEDEVEYHWHLKNLDTGDIVEDVFHTAADPVEFALARMEKDTRYRMSIKSYSPRCDRESGAKDITWLQGQ